MGFIGLLLGQLGGVGVLVIFVVGMGILLYVYQTNEDKKHAARSAREDREIAQAEIEELKRQLDNK